MSDLRTIEIDFGVHKLIEMQRQSFMETPNDVLRRLLKIGERSPGHSTPLRGGRPWLGKGVTLPHGTELRMAYNGRQYSGFIENGRWLVEGKSFASPSAAASGVAVTKSGKHTSLDGWIYWHFRRATDADWVSLKQARQNAGVS